MELIGRININGEYNKKENLMGLMKSNSIVEATNIIRSTRWSGRICLVDVAIHVVVRKRTRIPLDNKNWIDLDENLFWHISCQIHYSHWISFRWLYDYYELKCLYNFIKYYVKMSCVAMNIFNTKGWLGKLVRVITFLLIFEDLVCDGNKWLGFRRKTRFMWL